MYKMHITHAEIDKKIVDKNIKVHKYPLGLTIIISYYYI